MKSKKHLPGSRVGAVASIGDSVVATLNSRLQKLALQQQKNAVLFFLLTFLPTQDDVSQSSF